MLRYASTLDAHNLPFEGKGSLTTTILVSKKALLRLSLRYVADCCDGTLENLRGCIAFFLLLLGLSLNFPTFLTNDNYPLAL
jgi:hypothetical protein